MLPTRLTDNMLVHISSNNEVLSMFRQTPAGDGVWDGVRFVAEDPDLQADWFIGFDETARDCKTKVPLERRILFLTEPPTIKYYPRHFLKQFGHLVCSVVPSTAEGPATISSCGLPWMYGLYQKPVPMPWQRLVAGSQVAKTGEISVVCSTKKMNLNQHRRLRFLGMLKEALGDRLTFFGRGSNPIEDKSDAINSFRYHLVLENNLIDNGWTEKLADPILGGAFPIVSGGENLAEYFDPAGFRLIDTRKPRAAVEAVLKILDEDPFPSAQVAMADNKRRLMMQHQFFPIAVNVIRTLEAQEAVAPVQLETPAAFRTAAKPKWKKIASVPRPLRPVLRDLYLTVAERG
ncbi:Glycosyltransferase family 10 (fucosyltransferase) C-term [Roseibium suaedae]|uniref:Glycosyltransferase family 10 (Fucosyltransferase) C-term n=2 Tax=Roseibium suaedae TaxID=735517 RepID=A0A1M6YW56_9HYPH|nr:Glycosyltransferase family 10 (fucosyltransferase) C-term [Roseibium suaedae]